MAGRLRDTFSAVASVFAGKGSKESDPKAPARSGKKFSTETLKFNIEDLTPGGGDKTCFAFISVDNYDELLRVTTEESRALVSAEIDSKVRSWAQSVGAAVSRGLAGVYHIAFERREFEEMALSGFSILEDMHSIKTQADFPVSLSIGVGFGGATPAQSYEFANFAHDLALGRGGDQAVVKSDERVTYYGGRKETSITRNKGKSRVMAHAMKRLIAQADRVLIMGHKNPDFDAFGSAAAMYRMVFANGKSADIVVGSDTKAIETVTDKAHQSGAYSFVTAKDAAAKITPQTLLIVVDTAVPSIAENPELIEKCDKVVVIDHHRKSENYIEKAALTFLEPGASSTSELVCEILQYDDDVERISKFEADLMLAGITVDTNHFAIKTGPRTFEAAAWLRSEGADPAEVRLMLRSDREDFHMRAYLVANAEIDKDGIAITTAAKPRKGAQLICAQAANDLVDIKGVKAAFAVARSSDEQVVISARSLGDMNVQLVMEQLGGGGHLMSAAAQIAGSDIEAVTEKLKEVIKTFL
jgi:c-di-AMP phosphodiesterase-like protein